MVLAYNRVDLLRQCLENVALRTSPRTREILVWDNASSDGTADYLATLTDDRLRVVRHRRNIGLNGYARAFPLTGAPYLVVLDEDVIDAPPGWDERLLEAFLRLPDVGFLATNQVDDERSLCARIMHHDDRERYEHRRVNGVSLMEGPVGGWCAMTSRRLHDRVGGFPSHRRQVFFHFDSEYIGAIEGAGFRAAILEDLAVFHASGPEFSPFFAEKDRFYATLARARARRDAVKRVVLAVPPARRLNERHGWFEPPASGGGGQR